MSEAPALDHSPDRFVLLPFRRTEKDIPDWNLCTRYIVTYHSSNHTAAIDEAIRKMTNYHAVVAKTCTADMKPSPNESFIDHTLKKYCSLLGMAQAHLPLSGGKVSKNLKYFWRDSFDGTKWDTMNSNTELLSCIYNLAASYDHVAANQAHTGTPEAVKDAFRNFQNAAGYYNMVESLLSRLPAEQLKGDMKRESLTMLSRLCMAQAHHCGYLKAEDSMRGKHEILSKLAMVAGRLYEEVQQLLEASKWYETKSSMVKDVRTQLIASGLIMRARAHLHLAVQAEKAAEMGTAIGYFMKAQTYLAKMPAMPDQPMTIWVNSVITSVNKAQAKAVKDNDAVYYSRVKRDVPAPEEMRPLGQPTEHPSFVDFESKRGEDPFFGIVPAHIAAEAMQWREKQRKLAHVSDEAASKSRRDTQEKLQKLGVSAAIQTLSGEVQDRGRVPEPLRSNILALRNGEEGKVTCITDKLVQNVTTCDQLYQVALDKLKEVEKELAKEKEVDMSYASSYGETMWRAACPASEQLPDYLTVQSAITEHKKGLSQWVVTPFTAAKKTLDENLRDVARLDWPMADLDALMPFVQTREARQQTGKVMELVEELKALIAQKEELETQQKTEQKALQELIESDNIVFGLSGVEATQREAELAKGTKQVNEAIERVNSATREIRAVVTKAEGVMSRLGEVQSLDPLAGEIQKVTNSLENACQSYTELCKDFDNIVQYASKAIDGIESTLSNAKSFTLSRKLAADEVQSRLDAQIAAKMSQMQSAASAINDSQKRQEELRQQINSLQQQIPPNRYPSPGQQPQAAYPPYQPPTPPQQQQQVPPAPQAAYGQQQVYSYQPPPQQGYAPAQAPARPPEPAAVDRPPTYDMLYSQPTPYAQAPPAPQPGYGGYQPPPDPYTYTPMASIPPPQQPQAPPGAQQYYRPPGL